MLLLHPSAACAMQRNCHLRSSSFPTRNRTAMWYANGQVVDSSGTRHAVVSYFGLMRELAHDLSCQRRARLLGVLPGISEQLEHVPGEGRTGLRDPRL